MENINVCVRLRGLNPREVKSGERVVWDVQDETIGRSAEPEASEEGKKGQDKKAAQQFTFDHVFGPDTSNMQVFVRPLSPIAIARAGSCSMVILG